MNLSDRDRRAVLILGAALIVVAIVYFWPEGSGATVVAPVDSPQMAEKRLERTRQLVKQVPEKEAAFKKASAELALREKGMIQAETAAQAQAQLLQILRRVGRVQVPPVEIRATEFGQAKPFGDDYGEVSVSVAFDARVEQVINLLADLQAQPELIATSDMMIAAASGKEKVLPVRLKVSGIVTKKLIPARKVAEF